MSELLKSENIDTLTSAIISVMGAVSGIEKSMTVGSGSTSYKGVPDQEVKKIIGKEMQKNGLAIIPISVNAKTEVSRWTETYNGQEKAKQSVFTEVETKYILSHTSGQWVILSGYGHGTDSQDKGAGKATTYALKYCLLYTFMIATGKIDDADNTHSDDLETPQPQKTYSEDNRPWLSDKAFQQAMDRIAINEVGVFQKTIDTFKMKKEYRLALEEQNKKYNS